MGCLSGPFFLVCRSSRRFLTSDVGRDRNGPSVFVENPAEDTDFLQRTSRVETVLGHAPVPSYFITPCETGMIALKTHRLCQNKTNVSGRGFLSTRCNAMPCVEKANELTQEFERHNFLRRTNELPEDSTHGHDGGIGAQRRCRLSRSGQRCSGISTKTHALSRD